MFSSKLSGFTWPKRERDRRAIIRALLAGPAGLLILAALVWSAIAAAPPDLWQWPGEEAQSSLAAWGVDVEHLLLAMPLGATLVLFTRLVIGVDTFGIFTPMLLALAFLQLGPLLGPALIVATLVAGMIAMPLLEWLDLTRMGMMAVLIGLVASALWLLSPGGGAAITMVTAFPVVVSALVVERWWITRETEGLGEAFRLAAATFVLAILIQFALVAPVLRRASEAYALGLPVFGMLLAGLIARYRGLRLTELARFQPLIETRDGPSGN